MVSLHAGPLTRALTILATHSRGMLARLQEFVGSPPDRDRQSEEEIVSTRIKNAAMMDARCTGTLLFRRAITGNIIFSLGKAYPL